MVILPLVKLDVFSKSCCVLHTNASALIRKLIIFDAGEHGPWQNTGCLARLKELGVLRWLAIEASNLALRLIVKLLVQVDLLEDVLFANTSTTLTEPVLCDGI